MAVIQSIRYIYYQIQQSMQREGMSEQRQFECDLDRLISHMRNCQDNFLALATHIHTLLHPNDTILFVNQQIISARVLAERVRCETAVLQVEYVGVVQRWGGSQPVRDESAVLLKRVAYRLLQVFFSSVSTINNKIPHVLQDYLRVKVSCQRILQQCGNRPHQLIKAITDYQFKKLRKYGQLLTELTNQLENGDIDTFSKFQMGTFLDSRPSQREVTVQVKSPFYSTFKINKIKIREQQISKPEIATDKLKLIPTRKGKALYENLKDVMEISRQYFLQDYSYGQNSKEALLKQMLGRNKMNQNAIQQFYGKKRKIHNKIKSVFGQNKAELTSLDTQNHFQDGKSFAATRRNFLQKLKNNQKKILPSQLFKKSSKFDEVRTRMKSYNRERFFDEQKLQEGKVFEEAIQNKEDITVLIQSGNTACMGDRLPMLNKRAHSVDQNYKQHLEVDSPQARTLSNSLKINEDLRSKMKIEKVEMLPAKIKLQLKSFNAITSLQVNRKLGKAGQFNKYLYF